MDADLAAAIAASLADEPTQERTKLANEMLAQLGPIHPSEANEFRLCFENVAGDGFCFSMHRSASKLTN